MKFQIGDEVIILKSKYGDLNVVIGHRSLIKHCWNVSEPPKSWERQQPEYEVEIDGRHWLVLEEEIDKV